MWRTNPEWKNNSQFEALFSSLNSRPQHTNIWNLICTKQKNAENGLKIINKMVSRGDYKDCMPFNLLLLSKSTHTNHANDTHSLTLARMWYTKKGTNTRRFDIFRVCEPFGLFGKWLNACLHIACVRFFELKDILTMNAIEKEERMYRQKKWAWVMAILWILKPKPWHITFDKPKSKW